MNRTNRRERGSVCFIVYKSTAIVLFRGIKSFKKPFLRFLSDPFVINVQPIRDVRHFKLFWETSSAINSDVADFETNYSISYSDFVLKSQKWSSGGMVNFN